MTRVNTLLEDPQLISLNGDSVANEIDYLAEKSILTGSSGTGRPPYTEVKINGSGLQIVRFVLKEFPKYLAQTENEDCKLKSRQVLAMYDAKGKRRS